MIRKVYLHLCISVGQGYFPTELARYIQIRTAHFINIWDLDLAIFGLSLFTFLSGFKFVLNQESDIRRTDFLEFYFRKRAIRLGKPYIGYTLLMIVPFSLAYILSKKIELLQKFEGLNL